MANRPYLHGFSREEQDRLYRQARFFEPIQFGKSDFGLAVRLLEIGSGVGAVTEILLKHAPNAAITCIELSSEQIARAKEHLKTLNALSRVEIIQADAAELPFENAKFDTVVVSWVLEHAPNPAKILAECKRVLEPGGTIDLTEVLNSTLSIMPSCPAIESYWMAFNQHQTEIGGHPQMGLELGGMLHTAGFTQVKNRVETFLVGPHDREERDRIMSFIETLFLSAAPELEKSGAIDPSLTLSMTEEWERLKAMPESALTFGFVKATAKTPVS